jgi:hypothetical protein
LILHGVGTIFSIHSTKRLRIIERNKSKDFVVQGVGTTFQKKKKKPTRITATNRQQQSRHRSRSQFVCLSVCAHKASVAATAPALRADRLRRMFSTTMVDDNEHDQEVSRPSTTHTTIVARINDRQTANGSGNGNDGGTHAPLHCGPCQPRAQTQRPSMQTPFAHPPTQLCGQFNEA